MVLETLDPCFYQKEIFVAFRSETIKIVENFTKRCQKRIRNEARKSEAWFLGLWLLPLDGRRYRLNNVNPGTQSPSLRKGWTLEIRTGPSPPATMAMGISLLAIPLL